MSTSSKPGGKTKPAGSVPTFQGPPQYYGESMVNLSLVDPPRWGWTAGGGIADLLPPHEAARRKSVTKMRERPKKRDRTGAFIQKQPPGAGALKIPPQMAPPLPKASLLNGQGPTHNTLESTELKPNAAPENNPLKVKIDDAAADPAVPTNPIETTASDPPSAKERVLPYVKKASESLQQHDDGQHKYDGKKGPIHYRALKDDGTVDIYTYHRGREGTELRDKATGELLCDVDPTDTNAGAERHPPVVSVTVKFPLEDPDPSSLVACMYFRENIQWDLSDPQTPTPMLFAARLADQFGLSFTQTLELAESIQGQVQSFVNEYCKFSEPMSLKSATIHEKHALYAPTLYGLASANKKEGFIRLANRRQKPVSRGITARPERPGKTPSKVSSKTAIKAVGKQPEKSRKEIKVQVVEEQADEMYRDEVMKRLRDASVCQIVEKSKAKGEDTGTPRGCITPKQNPFCHHCRVHQPTGSQFACGSEYHSYCSRHFEEELNLVHKSDGPPLTMEYCPICSCSCKCRACASRMNRVALDLKKKCQEQNCVPGNVTFEDILQHCSSLESKVRGVKPGGRGRKRKVEQVERPSVPKVPVSEFPREIFNGNDLDPGKDVDYATVYSERGSFTATHIPKTMATTVQAPLANAKSLSEEAATGVALTAEDGSVDFCNICRKVGNLLCCDYCPRAYHKGCLSKKGVVPEQSDALWECLACCLEKEGLPEDRVDGEESLSIVSAKFNQSSNDSLDEIKAGLCQLSIIHQIVSRLMSYDFGYIFRHPVDCNDIPTYKDFVKHPMDLGTISTNLIMGHYLKNYDKRKSLDDSVIAVLNHIELVWHNCYLFNYEGSAVYRMAEVQQRRARAMREISLEPHLSERAKQETAEYAAAREKERGKFRRVDPAPLERASSQKTQNPRQQARHKIAVSGNGMNGRPIAVLDPDTGVVAKIYSTMQAAFATAELFLSLGYKAEFVVTDLNRSVKIRKIVIESGGDASILLFGYRWIFWDDLKAGKISFAMANPNAGLVRATSTLTEDSAISESVKPKEKESARLVELTDTEGHILVFPSLKESLAYVGISTPETAAPELHLYLLSLDSARNFLDPEGRTWRVMPSDSTSDLNILDGVVVIKQDLLSNRILVGFRSVAAAYRDWLRTRDASPIKQDETSLLEDFQERYLLGDANIEGVVWSKTRERGETDQISEASIEPVSSYSHLKHATEETSRNGCNHLSTPRVGGDSLSDSENKTSPSIGLPTILK